MASNLHTLPTCAGRGRRLDFCQTFLTPLAKEALGKDPLQFALNQDKANSLCSAQLMLIFSAALKFRVLSPFFPSCFVLLFTNQRVISVIRVEFLDLVYLVLQIELGLWVCPQVFLLGENIPGVKEEIVSSLWLNRTS